MPFLETLDLKNLLTIAISAIALVVSMISFFCNRERHGYEDKRELRSQLSEIMLKINDTVAEAQQIWTSQSGINDPTIQAKSAELNHRNAMLVRQASYLMDDKPELVTDVEYLTVATALTGIGDYPHAEKYYLLAIQTAPNAYYKSINLRSYADSLFVSGDDVKGRETYEETLTCLPNNGDFNIWHNAQIHQMWGVSEARFGSLTYAQRRFDRARELYNRLGNPNVKSRGIEGLDQVIDSIYSSDGRRDAA